MNKDEVRVIDENVKLYVEILWMWKYNEWYGCGVLRVIKCWFYV